jgi:hypothetical protein
MDRYFHRKRTCLICGYEEVATVRGFSSATMYCGKHFNDEVDLHQRMPANRRDMSKEDKALERIFAKRWKDKAVKNG